MAQYGTTMPVVKTAIYNLLAARVNAPTTAFTLAYGSPTDATQLLAESGAGVAAWWSDDVDCEISVPVFVAGDKWFDETYTLTLVIQGLALNTDDTQDVIDQRASQVLGEAIGLLAHDPVAAITDTSTYQIHEITPEGGWSYRSGVLNLQRAGHFEYRIAVAARLKLS
jgi:hypothetical protein